MLSAELLFSETSNCNPQTIHSPAMPIHSREQSQLNISRKTPPELESNEWTVVQVRPRRKQKKNKYQTEYFLDDNHPSISQNTDEANNTIRNPPQNLHIVPENNNGTINLLQFPEELIAEICQKADFRSAFALQRICSKLHMRCDFQS